MPLAHGKPEDNKSTHRCALGPTRHIVQQGAPLQANYIDELLEIFETEGVDSAFVYTFARYDFCGEFDLISKGIVKVLDRGGGQRYPDMPWEPKAAFDALGRSYGVQSGRL